MPSQHISAKSRPEFNVTSASTLHHLIGVAVACVGLWAIIVATVAS